MQDNTETMIEFIASKTSVPVKFDWGVSALNRYPEIWDMFYSIKPKDCFYNEKIESLVHELQVWELRVTPATNLFCIGQSDFFKKSNERRLNIIIKKNNDYAGKDGGMKNFYNVERLGISAETGIMVRISDKLCRLENLLTGTKAKVTDESITDTIDDAINYLRLMQYCTHLRKKRNKNWLSIVNKLNFFSKKS